MRHFFPSPSIPDDFLNRRDSSIFQPPTTYPNPFFSQRILKSDISTSKIKKRIKKSRKIGIKGNQKCFIYYISGTNGDLDNTYVTNIEKCFKRTNALDFWNVVASASDVGYILKYYGGNLFMYFASSWLFWPNERRGESSPLYFSLSPQQFFFVPFR